MHIGNLKPWDLFAVLTQKYNWSPLDAEVFADFLIPMLEYDITKRATAEECLKHPWVQNKHASENYASIVEQLRAAKAQAVSELMKQNSINELAKTIQSSNLINTQKIKLKYSASTKLPNTKAKQLTCCVGEEEESMRHNQYKSDATATSSSSAISSSNSSTKNKQYDSSSGNHESDDCDEFSKLVINNNSNSGNDDEGEEETEEYMDNYIRLVNEYSKNQDQLFPSRIYKPPMAHKRLIQHRHSL